MFTLPTFYSAKSECNNIVKGFNCLSHTLWKSTVLEGFGFFQILNPRLSFILGGDVQGIWRPHQGKSLEQTHPELQPGQIHRAKWRRQQKGSMQKENTDTKKYITEGNDSNSGKEKTWKQNPSVI